MIIPKQNKASSQIGKLVRSTVLWHVDNKKTAFKGNVKSVVVKPLIIGNALAKDLDALIASSYLKARRQIPRDATFRIWASCEFDAFDEDGKYHTNRTSTSFDSHEINQFFKDFSGLL